MILFIDTTTSYPIISIIEDRNIKYMYNKKVDNDISVSIFSIIEEGFKKLNITPKDIEKIIVANGPGSFTGTRIGVTIAKIYSYSLNIKVIPVSSLEILATSDYNTDYIVPLIDARRGYVYAGIYDKKLKNIFFDNYISLDELTKHLENKEYTFVSNDDFNFNVEKPNIDILKVIDKHYNDNGVNPHSLNPNYLKKTEAEEKLNDKQNK